MAYGSNKFDRIDRLETTINEQIIALNEAGSECLAENAYEEAEEISLRVDQLELRLERLAHISANLSINNMIDAISPY